MTRHSSLSQANHADISNKLRDAHDEDRDNITAQGRLLRRIQDQVKENNVLLVANNNITSNIKEALRLDWFKQLGSELRAFMQRIITINISTYNALIAIQQTISSRPELSLLQEPFILEDAIGRISPVHMQFINSWEAFHAVLSRRFQDVQGYKKVQSGEYILQEHVTRREISRSHRWEAAILPGQRIEMSFVFNSESRDSVSASCPSCNKVSDGSPDAEILW